MKRLVRRAGLEEEFEIASAATRDDELGNPVYPLAKRKLAEHGIGCPGKTARGITLEDYDRYDMIIGMDDETLDDLKYLFPSDEGRKISLLLDHTPESDTKHHNRNVADPWYTRRFDEAWDDINTGCTALFEKLKNELPEEEGEE